MNGHELARQIIVRHGVDRYPEPHLQALKVLEELGELAGEILKATDWNGPYRLPADAARAKIRKEYGDAGLALYALGNKLGLDLGECMTAVVDGETRTFA
jgi:NTP pyrophosphatase (non-canonical NTP hydrolase)